MWPQIEMIRAAVKEAIPIKGSIKLSVYNNKNEFIDVF